MASSSSSFTNHNGAHSNGIGDTGSSRRSQTTAFTDWVDHWSKMFPFVTELPFAKDIASSSEQEMVPHNHQREASDDAVVYGTDNEILMTTSALQLKRFDSSFQEDHHQTISPTLDNHTARTSFSSSTDYEAWNTSRNFSFNSFMNSLPEAPDDEFDDETVLSNEEETFDDIVGVAIENGTMECVHAVPYYPRKSNNQKTSNKTNKKRKKARHSRFRSQPSLIKTKYHRCDKTTKCLIALVVILTLLLIILGVLTKPVRRGGVPTNTTITSQPPQVSRPSINQDNDIGSPPSFRPRPLPTLAPPDVNPPASVPVGVVDAPVAVFLSPTASPLASPIASIESEAPIVATNSPQLPIDDTTDNPAPSSTPTRPIDPVDPMEPVTPFTMGPMVGHVTDNSVKLWAYHSQSHGNMELVLYDAFDQVLRIDFIAPNPELDNIFLTTLTDLQPSTFYKYGMHLKGQRVGQGHFQTAPTPKTGGGTQFDYVLASCMNARQYRYQHVWDAIRFNAGGKYPDFSILAGDTIYLQDGIDVNDVDGVIYDRVWFRNQEQREDPYFANFISNVPTYSTWNDHEYGKNDADKNQLGKDRSLRAWQSLWANPGYGDADTDDGVYYSFYHGDVHYLVTDDRWYKDTALGNRLGDKQTEWLRQELIASTGTFKVIVIGSDIMQRGFNSDLLNIGRIVTDHGIEGVLFHAGDIHRNEFKTMRAEGIWPYNVTQITSSGIARVWRRPYVHIKVDTTVEDPTMTAHFYGATNTNDDSTWINDPNLQCSSIVGEDRDKEHSCTETVRLSSLRIP